MQNWAVVMVSFYYHMVNTCALYLRFQADCPCLRSTDERHIMSCFRHTQTLNLQMK